MVIMRRLLALLCFLVLPHAAGAALVLTAEIDGPISPAAAEHLTRALKQAGERDAALLLVKLDTPGGLDTSMRDMIRAILASPVPVAIYVAPSGARAASAGTFLLYASHIAAMAPGTNVGAATPIPIGIGEQPERRAPDDATGEKKDKSVPGSADAMRAKQVNDAAAYIRSLAQLRNRNAEWAERAVRGGESLAAEEALKQKVIDLVAADERDLLRKLDGRVVKVADGERTLATADAQTETVERNWRNRLLGVIADPNIALLLLVLGFYGVLFELYHPTFGGAGVAGAICLLLGFYGLQLLPINYIGLLLILLGLGLMAAEAFMPSFGAFGIGGVVAFVVGTVLLMDAEIPGLEVSWGMTLPLGVLMAVALFVTGTLALKARRRPVVSGHEEMIGTPAEALEDFSSDGWVRAHGENWRARSRVPVHRGDLLRVARIDGLILEVEPDHGTKGRS